MRAKVNSIELGGTTNLAVMAPIKAGFVPGFETMTYLDRLRRLLKAMHSARQNTRESELRPPVFPDSIGRFGIIHSFRYTVVPPHPATGGIEEQGASRLSLNVSFDGGWEPYMRVIFRDIGSLLDALFCHCEGYPGSQKVGFDTYCRWVRDNEFNAGIFYTDSPATLTDVRYLSEIERLQREAANPDEADQAIARFALDSERQQVGRAFQSVWLNPTESLALPLRGLKGLYRLSPYFPRNEDRDDLVLLRFAQSALREFTQVIARPELQKLEAWQGVAPLFREELAWLGQPDRPLPQADRLTYSRTGLQDAILNRDDPVTHGCIVLLGVRDADAATKALADLAAKCGAPTAPDQIRHHVTFTYEGLASLKIAPGRLDVLPQEFAEGMEARCGLLGDVRTNHPDRWHRPRRYSTSTMPLAGDRVDLTSV
ncbi:MAG: hypothetical protein ABIV63_05315, partial [Caldimonas sp.]